MIRRACRLAFAPALLVVLLASVLELHTGTEPPGSDKIHHALAFFVLAALASAGYPRWPLWRGVFLGLVAYGLVIEGIQWPLPWRDFSLWDWAADAAGAALACAWMGSRAVVDRSA